MVRDWLRCYSSEVLKVSVAGRRPRSLREVSVRCEPCGEKSNFPHIVLTAVQDRPDPTDE